VQAIEFIRTRLLEDGTVEPLPGTKFLVQVETVIRAIGQSKQTGLIEQFGLRHTSGVINVDDGFRTSQPNIFAAGDNTFSRGGAREAMVVEAAEQGKIVARSVDAFLKMK
jgi:dihydropyrimidine dehydrogenase (NAD+) subunit PreT